MDNKILVGHGLLVIGLLIIVFLGGGDSSSPTGKAVSVDSIQKGTNIEEDKGTVDANTYTLADVEKHNSEDDCWIALSGKVYDVTAFIASGNHGPAIAQGCGTDGTELYVTRPMGSGTPHSDNARSLRENYYISELA